MIHKDKENLINLDWLNLSLIKIKKMIFLYLWLKQLPLNWHQEIIKRQLSKIQMMVEQEEMTIMVMVEEIAVETVVDMTVEMVEETPVEMVEEMAVEMVVETGMITIQKIYHITMKISSVCIHYIWWLGIDEGSENKVMILKNLFNEEKKLKKEDSWKREQNQFDIRKFLIHF